MSFRGLALCIAFAIAAPASTQAGDFGRPKPSFFEGLIPQQFWRGPVAGYSGYPLTDLEVELRDRSYVLIRPNEPRGNWNIYIAGFVEVANAGGDFQCRRFALHLCRKDQNPSRIMPPSEHIQNVA